MTSKATISRLHGPQRPTIAIILLAIVIQALAVASLIALTFGRSP